MSDMIIYSRRALLIGVMLLALSAALFGAGASESSVAEDAAVEPQPEAAAAEAQLVNPPLDVEYLDERSAMQQGYAAATFAGGCFWCMEGPYDKLEGVVSTTSGYAGGHVVNPRYQEVGTGTTGHAQVVQVVYDPEIISYERLLEVFWVNVDPVDAGGQFCDRGSQYRSAIFYHTPQQREEAIQSLRRLDRSGVLPGPIVTEVSALEAFYPAEEYHQDYYRKNPIRYRFYRTACRRDARLTQLWGEQVE